MPAPNIAGSTRYFNPEITRIVFMPTVATLTAPTRVEINAGTDLSNEIADLSGWVITSGTIDTPDLGSRFTSRIGGRLSVDDSSLTMYADVGGVDVRTLLPRTTTGVIAVMDGGDVAGRKMDLFRVEVLSNGKSRSAGDDAATIEVQFSITAKPAENVTVPA